MRILHTRKMALLDHKGDPQYLLGVSEDITERKRAEESVRQLNTDLQKQSAQLQAANKELEAFSYSVSHDLRAPLRSIDGFSQALLEDYADQLDEQGKDYLQRVRASTQRMGELIDDLLNLSRVSRGTMRLETVDLSAMAKNITAELQKAQRERRVDIVIADGMVATGDTGLFKVALENLLGNAWKFTGKCPDAKIEFGVAHQNGKHDYFVRDNGAGFDPAYTAKLFGAFQRLHDAREFPGTGIGLATVQRIIHRHGGSIWAEGKPNEGATFYFTLEH
jgi:light-regulated signal transduction histidine kinase (bacteriophytochrome)